MHLLSKHNGEKYDLKNCYMPLNMYKKGFKHGRIYEWEISKEIIITGSHVQLWREKHYGMCDYFEYNNKWYRFSCVDSDIMNQHEEFEMKTGASRIIPR